MQTILKKIGINLSNKEYQLDIKPFVKLVLSRFLGDSKALVDVLVNCLPNVRDGTKTKVLTCYPNRSDSTIAKQISLCDSKGPLAVNIVKMFNNEHMGTFYAFGRIVSGTLNSAQHVKILGESFTVEEQEDMQTLQVQKLWLLQAGGRFKIEVDKAFAGQWIAIEGIDQAITKTATLTDIDC